ncbi:hypothetical protein Plim_3046 [Planctopirus limnophila DSM 3776]|uniref:Uncharacterized protein n=1 Tax=Planctopirus limnophila (strain ATCC 43296 / DSM 3776 / IFAM 1008 / Mu 290) TaxID=521674 RepID=D5SSR7_PLAL2|nr:hypothetical protein [Planctopirus limnophila]ADG68868.1 hypothetical protein Plim_3046 [Planctopirus limnophila DSM 3776]
MLLFTRGEARRVLAVLRKAGLVNFSRRIQPPITLVQAGSQLRILCATKDCWGLWEREPGSHETRSSTPSEPVTRVTVSAELLRECQGSDAEVVTLEIDQDIVKASWSVSGFAVEREFPVFDAPDEHLFQHPREYFSCPPEFLSALRQVMAVRDSASTRYALNCVQLSGSRQQLAGTDSQKLLIHRGIQLPWPEDLLVQGTDLLEALELQRVKTVRMGRTEHDLVLQLGHWTVGLKLNTESHYPPVDRVVPWLSDDATRLELHPLDATRLEELLHRMLETCSSRLPTMHQPLTVDLTGDVPIVRCRTNHSPRATEIRLSRSSRHGLPGKVCLETRFLVSALEMGFQQLAFHKSDSPVRLDQHQRIYILMPLDPDSLIPPGDDHVITTGPEAEEVDRAPVFDQKQESPLRRTELAIA